MADIFYQGRVYLNVHQVKRLFPVTEHTKIGTCLYLENFESHPVHGSHNFKDGEDVTGRYKIESRGGGLFIEGPYINNCVYCKKDFEGTDKLWFCCRDCSNEIVAYPIPTPPDKVEGVKEGVKEEAKALINSFYQPLGFLKCGVSSNEMWEYSKKRASEHCDLIIEEVRNYCDTNHHQDRMNYYIKLKAAINKL